MNWSNWNFMRVMRLVLGAFIVVQGIVTHEWIFAIMGAIFAGMAMLNVGCCGAAGCNVPRPRNRNTTSSTTDVSYEEVR